MNWKEWIAYGIAGALAFFIVVEAYGEEAASPRYRTVVSNDGQPIAVVDTEKSKVDFKVDEGSAFIQMLATAESIAAKYDDCVKKLPPAPKAVAPKKK